MPPPPPPYIIIIQTNTLIVKKKNQYHCSVIATRLLKSNFSKAFKHSCEITAKAIPRTRLTVQKGVLDIAKRNNSFAGQVN